MLLERLIELDVFIDPTVTVIDVSFQEASAPPGSSAYLVSLDRTEHHAVLATPPGAQIKPNAAPATLPQFKLFFQESHGPSSDAKLEVCLQ